MLGFIIVLAIVLLYPATGRFFDSNKDLEDLFYIKEDSDKDEETSSSDEENTNDKQEPEIDLEEVKRKVNLSKDEEKDNHDDLVIEDLNLNLEEDSKDHTAEAIKAIEEVYKSK